MSGLSNSMSIEEHREMIELGKQREVRIKALLGDISVKYAGFSTYEKPILSKLYSEGWAAVVKAGYHPPTTVDQDNDNLHHFLAKCGRKHVGILSFWEDTSYVPSEAQVMMLYVKPGYRRRQIGENLMDTARAWCASHKYGTLSAAVHVDNTPMRQAQEKLAGSLEYVIYQHQL